MNAVSQQSTKKQHYVPQSYLKRFSCDGERIYVYDKFCHNIRKSNIKDVAEENYFYDIPKELVGKMFAGTELEGKEVDRQSAEKALAVFDGYFKKTVDDLINSVGAQGISQGSRSMMGFFITLQIMRTRTYRSQIIELRRKFTQTVIEKTGQGNFPDLTPDLYPTFQFEDEKAVTLHLHSLFDIEELDKRGEALENHIWLIGINKTTQPFFTSDNPVVKFAHKKHPVLKFDGFLSPGIEIAYPLTPQHILILCEKSYFFLRQTWEGKAIPLGADDVLLYNEMQVLQSYRQIYCSAEQFDGVKSLCEQNPEACLPDRNTWEDTEINRAVDEFLKV